jgi:hypothetical protein
VAGTISINFKSTVDAIVIYSSYHDKESCPFLNWFNFVLQKPHQFL